MSDPQRDSFRKILAQIAELAASNPDYRFEHIDAYTRQLTAGGDPAPWVEAIDRDWQELSPQRQEACRQIFEYALLQARQATYRPVNALDAFLERQLYGIEDDQVIQKGAVSQALKQADDRRGRAAPVQPIPSLQQASQPLQPNPSAQPMPSPAPPVRGAPPAAGRTNPLNPRQIPKGPEPDKI